MLIDATVNDYVSWIYKALERGIKPRYYYDYPMPRMARATSDFTMNDECGARAVHILIDEGVRYTGLPGHNRLYLWDGSTYNVGMGFSVYSNPEFLEIPGMQVFREAELRLQALEDAERESRHAREDMMTSDVRNWSKR